MAYRDDPSTGTLRINAQRLRESPGLSGEGTGFRLVFMAGERGSGTVVILSEGGGANQTGNQPRAMAQAVVTVK